MRLVARTPKERETARRRKKNKRGIIGKLQSA
jgi:hypothetical protein